MKPLFRIEIALESDGNYSARTFSCEDGQQNHAVAKRLPVLMKTVSSRLSKRRQQNVKFPHAEKRIITNGGGVSLIVPGRN